MFVVFDLDGTLADDTHRQHFLEQSPADWIGYFAACSGDGVIAGMDALFDRLSYADVDDVWRIEIWTGRPREYRDQTMAWLEMFHVVPDSLRMRPTGDFRPDTEVKGEWLAECGDNRPDLVFDDRTKSVAWWRSQGITCLQAADHNF